MANGTEKQATKKGAKARGGRPTKLTEALIKRLCGHVEAGETHVNAGKLERVAEATLRRWKKDDAGFAVRLVEADLEGMKKRAGAGGGTAVAAVDGTAAEMGQGGDSQRAVGKGETQRSEGTTGAGPVVFTRLWLERLQQRREAALLDANLAAAERAGS